MTIAFTSGEPIATRLPNSGLGNDNSHVAVNWQKNPDSPPFVRRAWWKPANRKINCRFRGCDADGFFTPQRFLESYRIKQL